MDADPPNRPLTPGRRRAEATDQPARTAADRSAATPSATPPSEAAHSDVPPEPSVAARPARKGGVRGWLVRGALLVAGGLLLVALARGWHDVSASVQRLRAVGVAGAAAATVLAVGLTVLSWRAVLAGLGAYLPVRAATRIFFVGQVGKYIPGSVWPVLAQMELSRDYGVSRPRSGAASLIVLALAVPCGGLAAAATLPFVSRAALTHYWWAFVAVPLFMVVLAPPVLSRLLAMVFRLLRRPPLTDPLTTRAVLAGAGWLLVSFGCYGVATFLLARDLAPAVGGPRLLALSVGGYALAWTAGFLVLVLPAGAGVREGVLVLALAPALPREAALVLAVVARLLATVADLVWAGVGVALRPRGAAALASSADNPASEHPAPESPPAAPRIASRH